MELCPVTSNQIILLHSQFGARTPVGCGSISAVPVNQELQNYISDITIPVEASFNGSSVRCGRSGQRVVGTKVLRVGAIPLAPSRLKVSSLTRGKFSLTWMEPTNVYGGIGSYRVNVHSDQSGDLIRLCGCITAPNGDAAPVREFTDWVPEGQTCYFSVATVAGNNCNLTSALSQEVSITLQGPNSEIVKQIILNAPVYIDNQLKLIDISFMYTQEAPIIITDGVTSITTHFSITYSYSTSGSDTIILPLSCNQKQWCNYSLTLDNYPTKIFGRGIFSVVPLNVIGIGNSMNLITIANRNPLFRLSAQNGVNSPRKTLQLRFLRIFTSATCFMYVGLGEDCSYLNLSKVVVQMNSDVVFVDITLAQSGVYCYRINCTVTPNTVSQTSTAQGTLEYQTVVHSGDIFPLWTAAIIIVVLILAVVDIIIILFVLMWKKKSKENCRNQEGRNRQGRREESGVPVYEEISRFDVSNETIEMGENVAYGPVVS